MTTIEVDCLRAPPGWRCVVAANDGRTAGEHTVTVTSEDAARLATAHDQKGVERLVYETFAFLLEREPRSSVLQVFDLTVVGGYFPEFESEMAQRLGP